MSTARPQWRNFLTTLGKKTALASHIEHALTPAAVTFVELYRTYDVGNIMAIPHTIDRISQLDLSRTRNANQDLAGDKPVDITQKVIIGANDVVIPGSLIDEIGLMNATKGDLSEPGMVVVIK